MSLKLLIADDEYFIRQRIKKDHTLGKTKSYFCRRSRKRTAGHRPSGKRTRGSAASGYQNAAYERNRNCQIYQRAFSFCAYAHFIGL